MSDRISRSPMLVWNFTCHGWRTTLNGRVLILAWSDGRYQLRVNGDHVCYAETFNDGVDVAARLPQFHWKADLAITAKASQKEPR